MKKYNPKKGSYVEYLKKLIKPKKKKQNITTLDELNQ